MNELKNKRIVFHGTEKKFNKFSDEAIGQGGDPNSCLGIFFAEDPAHAAEYAGEDGLVVVAVINNNKAKIADLEHQIVLIPEALEKYHIDCQSNGCTPLNNSQLDFFETKDDYKICAYFAREYYIKEGYDNLQYCEVGTDTPICVSLHTKDIEILRLITPQEAQILSQQFYQFDNIYDQEKRFQAISSIIDNKPAKQSQKKH